MVQIVNHHAIVENMWKYGTNDNLYWWLRDGSDSGTFGVVCDIEACAANADDSRCGVSPAFRIGIPN